MAELNTELKGTVLLCLPVWTNLTVDLEERPTANSLMVEVLDQIYVRSPLGP